MRQRGHWQVLRVFATPHTLIRSFSRIGGEAALSAEDEKAVRPARRGASWRVGAGRVELKHRGVRAISHLVAQVHQSTLWAATTPVLGLSNKAIATGADGANPYAAADEDGDGTGAGAGDDPFGALVPSQLELECPPFEEQLMQGTLWAELEKLYDIGALTPAPSTGAPLTH